METTSRPVSESLDPSFAAQPAVDGALDPHLLAKIAIVDDEPINIKVVRKHLQIAGYQNFITTTDSTEAMALIVSEMPDVILLDVMMPQVSGIEILRAVRADPKLHHIPVLILTASTDTETKLKALEAGATDFLPKPVDAADLVPRIRNALIVKAHRDHLSHYSEQLAEQVRLRTAELEVSHLQVIQCLARAAEYRDDTTGQHIVRVGRYVSVLARQLGFSPAEVDMLCLAAQLHDVGKIGVPDGILLKPGRLTEQEYAIVKTHCEIGFQIVQPVDADDFKSMKLFRDTRTQCESPLLAMAARIAHTHHERWDGKGYPRRLACEDIPIEGRITSVADVFDALTTARPYKEAYPTEKALAMMEEGRGTQFDPAILDALLRGLPEILSIRAECADPSPDKLAA
jgi:putative two-component system response regulator